MKKNRTLKISLIVAVAVVVGAIAMSNSSVLKATDDVAEQVEQTATETTEYIVIDAEPTEDPEPTEESKELGAGYHFIGEPGLGAQVELYVDTAKFANPVVHWQNSWNGVDWNDATADENTEDADRFYTFTVTEWNYKLRWRALVSEGAGEGEDVAEEAGEAPVEAADAAPVEAAPAEAAPAVEAAPAENAG